jgi:hypothetical protein
MNDPLFSFWEGFSVVARNTVESAALDATALARLVSVTDAILKEAQQHTRA